jgi:hypothetical protein
MAYHIDVGTVVRFINPRPYQNGIFVVKSRVFDTEIGKEFFKVDGSFYSADELLTNQEYWDSIPVPSTVVELMNVNVQYTLNGFYTSLIRDIEGKFMVFGDGMMLYRGDSEKDAVREFTTHEREWLRKIEEHDGRER